MDAAQAGAVDQELAKAQEAFARGIQARCATSEVQDAIARRIEKFRGGMSLPSGEVLGFARSCQWFVCEDGSALGAHDDGLIWGLEADVSAAREATQGMTAGSTAGSFVKPIMIAGLHNPWLLIEAYRATSKSNNGYLPRIYVYEPDLKVVAMALAQEGMEEVAGQSRVCWAVGPQAQEQLKAFFQAHARWALPECVYAQPRVMASGDVGAWCAGILEQGKQAQCKEVQCKRELIEKSQQKHESNWLKRGGESWDGVRVLVLTSRYTTFLKHSASDLAESLTRLGASVKILMEPDFHSLLSAGAYLDVIHEHAPEVVFTINYPRSHLADIVPKDVPLVCWVQDAMPHLFAASAGAGQGAKDLVIGHLYPELFERFGYSQNRVVSAAVVADEVKFHATAVKSGERAKYECDIALVSHHSETPEAMHNRMVASARVAPAITRVMERIYIKMNDVVAAAARVPAVKAVEGVILTSMREVLGDDGEAATRLLLLRTYAMPMADRILRHQTLEWVDEMAVRRGWRVKLYGKGWEQHPTMQRYAAGELEHGESLRAAYQGAKAHLHLSLHSLVHQRLLECYLSGGVCLVRWHRDALAGLKTTAYLELRKVTPDARKMAELGVVGSGGGASLERAKYEHAQYKHAQYEHFGYLISKHEAAGVLARQYAALGQPIEGDTLWIPSVKMANLVAMGPRVNTQTDLGEVLGEDFGQGVFRNQAELEARVDRVITQALEDPLGREAHIERVRKRITSGYTYGVLLERVLHAMCVCDDADMNKDANESIFYGRSA